MNGVVLQYINFVSGLLSYAVKLQSQRRLKRLSVYLDFNELPEGWIKFPHPADLTNVWRKAGLPVEGVGYSTIGSPTRQRQLSTRFVPDSPFYQAWLGGYVVKCDGNFGIKPDGSPSPEVLMQVAVADQITWLHNYGCKSPNVSIKESDFRMLERMEFQGYPAWLMEGTFLSNSDVGRYNCYVNGYFIYRIYERMFERFGGTRLPPLCTLPASTELPSYHPLELDGLVLFVPIYERKVWVILYGCGARWDSHDYFSKLRDGILSAIRNTTIKLI